MKRAQFAVLVISFLVCSEHNHLWCFKKKNPQRVSFPRVLKDCALPDVVTYLKDEPTDHVATCFSFPSVT